MTKQIINITDITEFLYCPRKVYLRLVKGLRTQPTQRMILGMLRHKIFDTFNRNEKPLIESINEKVSEAEIKKLYEELLEKIIRETFSLNGKIAYNFRITEKELSHSAKESITPEISLRVPVVFKTIQSGFLGKELWRNLHPKFLSEYKIESQELGLRGRIDRIKFDDKITPVEIKSREKIYDSDKIQLAGYALLLESEFGKPITLGIMENMGKQQQVDLTEELKSQVQEIAEKIRNLTDENAQLPSNFAKCEKCEHQKVGDCFAD